MAIHGLQRLECALQLVDGRGKTQKEKQFLSPQAHNGAGLGEAATTTATTQKAANVGAIVASVLSGLLIVGVGVAAFIYRDKLRNVIARKTSKRWFSFCCLKLS